MEGGAVGHNFEMGLPKDYPSQIWFNLIQRFREENLNVIFYQNMTNLHNRHPPFKIAAVTKNRHFLNCPWLIYYKSK
jgi:hypothetical protein